MEKEEEKRRRIRSGYVDTYIGQTTDQDLQMGYQLVEQEESIIGKITEEMMFDGDDESDKLLDLYLESTPKERTLLDCALMALCGWSLHTIIDMMVKADTDNKEGVSEGENASCGQENFELKREA